MKRQFLGFQTQNYSQLYWWTFFIALICFSDFIHPKEINFKFWRFKLNSVLHLHRASEHSHWPSSAFEKFEKRQLASSCSFVYPSAWSNSAHTGRIFLFIFEFFFKKSLGKVQFHSNLTRISSTLHKDPRTFMAMVEVSATDWSLVQRSPIDCGASLCVIKKPRKRGG
jgi:hypothetical protein